jgi:beta-1,4-mannosyltransferase
MADPVKSATVLVLGDLGRSPRMLNHAWSLAKHGCDVDLVGYSGATLPADIRDCPRIRVHILADTASPKAARPSSRARYMLCAGVRAASVGLRLARLLVFTVSRPSLILVQNPPGIPTLPMAWAAARLRSAELVVDWHNLTSAMLALRLGPGHALVGLARAVERSIGRRAELNLFVSQAMADRLHETWGLSGVVFRDRPGKAFRPLETPARAMTRAGVLKRVGATGDEREWLLVLSPTSWTADEDFDLLLDAASRLDDLMTPLAPGPSPLKRVLVVASGRGALRQQFEHHASKLRLRRVTLSTVWMEPDEYPALVAAADVGLCLHRSASGLDLPMKVMDFFGAGVPVCALDYGPCLAEAVRDGDNGLTFADAPQLARLLVGLAGLESALIQQLRAGAAASGAVSWDTAWEKDVLPVLTSTARSGGTP